MEVSLLLSLLAIFALLLVSAFFSASETALTASSRVRLHAQAKEGSKRAALVNKIRQKKDQLIGALMIGNNLVNILASALATGLLIKTFGDAGMVYATAVMTVLVVIFCEVLPKTYAIHHAESLAKFLAPAVNFLVILFSPVTRMVTGVVRWILKMCGVDISNITAGSHLELLRGVIDLHRGPEQEIREQRKMLRSILDLFEVEVQDIMIHRKNTEMIDADQPLENIFKQVLENPYTRLPLWKGEQDNIIGIVHVKMLMKEMNEHRGDLGRITLESIIMEPWFIPETTSLHDQLQAFRERKEHFAVVVDEYGAFMGVVTLEDILEEIVGDIDDEVDDVVEGVRKMQDGTFVVDGTVTIRDLDREFGWGLPDNDYSTIAGLILHEAQKIPDVGQSFSFYGFRFDIIKRQRNQIVKIRVVPVTKKKAAAH